MRLSLRNRIGHNYQRGFLNDLLGKIEDQVNYLSEGNITAVTNARTTVPATGSYTQGDFVKNSAPTEAGGAGAKYVIAGWICIASGTPGTWREFRGLTGN